MRKSEERYKTSYKREEEREKEIEKKKKKRRKCFSSAIINRCDTKRRL